jgi:hypothetical protein
MMRRNTGANQGCAGNVSVVQGQTGFLSIREFMMAGDITAAAGAFVERFADVDLELDEGRVTRPWWMDCRGEARAWLMGRLGWEARLAQLRAEYFASFKGEES